jgi:hypothetical protein
LFPVEFCASAEGRTLKIVLLVLTGPVAVDAFEIDGKPKPKLGGALHG